ncbi:MAG TPA: hypothetical protein VLV86_11150, partial [Vicinamibacterales bacterium]|nr:hypothetical protein [Vicinamibacterales bacterium]
DLQGVWTSDDARSVPMQRPSQFGDRKFLTDEEFAERKRRDDETRGDTKAGAGTFVGEVGSRTVRQTSLVIDPPEGRTPPLTGDAQRRAGANALLRARLPHSWEDRSISDRCITRGILGALPTLYGNGLRIVQNPGVVAISYEMIHETRIVPLDGRPHLSTHVRLYMGDPRGRWEGDTLVIDTTNFNDATVVGQNQTSELLHVTERLTRVSPETIQYEATIDDPRTWTKPWTVTVPLSTQPGYQIFPYECHEGNFALRNILNAARVEERATAEAVRNGTLPPEPSIWQGNTGLLPDDPSFGRPQGR